jgi:hypothetical protein
LKFPLQQVEVPGNFLTTNVHGEFVLRTGTPPEQWAPVLDKILRTECELPVKLTLKEVERDVVVLGGNFESKPKGQYKNVITFGPAEQKNWGGSGNGNLDDFVVFLNQFTGKHVISEVKAPPKEKLWWFHQDSKIQGDETGRTRFVDAPEPDAIFKTVAEQTGLTVTAAKRKVRVLVVEKSD